MLIVPLDPGGPARTAEALEALDRLLVQELGREFTDEPWGAAHFLHPVPGKWAHSFLALGRAARPADPDAPLDGFWIASRSPSTAVGVYTHRVGIRAEARGGGAAWGLFEAVLGSARREGAPCLSLSVSTSNLRALSFYDRVGFRRLEGAALEAFLQARGVGSQALGDRIQEPTGHQKFVLSRPL